MRRRRLDKELGRVVPAETLLAVRLCERLSDRAARDESRARIIETLLPAPAAPAPAAPAAAPAAPPGTPASGLPVLGAASPAALTVDLTRDIAREPARPT
jgi:hypothetical protein